MTTHPRAATSRGPQTARAHVDVTKDPRARRSMAGAPQPCVTTSGHLGIWASGWASGHLGISAPRSSKRVDLRIRHISRDGDVRARERVGGQARSKRAWRALFESARLATGDSRGARRRQPRRLQARALHRPARRRLVRAPALAPNAQNKFLAGVRFLMTGFSEHVRAMTHVAFEDPRRGPSSPVTVTFASRRPREVSASRSRVCAPNA
jgi:hypothetical protein